MRDFFKNTRFTYRLVRAFIRRHLKIIIFFAIMGTAFFFVFPIITKFYSSRRPMRIGIVGKYTPEELPNEITEMISYGLTKIGDHGQIETVMAESWEIKNDGKEYIFNLKDNLFWHDGKKIQAKDINFNFTDVTTDTPDNFKVVFSLKEPFTPFLTLVSQPLFKKNLVGAGDYHVRYLKKNGQIIEAINLIPSANYQRTKPSFLFKFYPTEETALTAFKLGEINEIKNISKTEGLEEWKKAKIKGEINYDRLVAIFFNTSNPNLADKNVRQALAYALEKPWLPRAITPYKLDNWAYNASVKPYDFDVARAKSLLEKSKTESNNPLDEIELSTIPSLVKIAEKIKENWENINLKTKIKVINRLDENFQAVLLVQQIPIDPDQYILWHSTQTSNISHLKSPKIDKLLENGRKTLDQAARKQIYFDFQKSLTEETPAIFLYYPTSYTISRN